MTKLAHVLLLLKRILVAVDSRGDWHSTLNTQIRELAEANGLGVPNTVDLAGLALAAAKQAGASGADIEVVAMEAISRVLTRKPKGSGGLLENSKAYLRNTVLPNLVIHLKSKGMKLDAIKRDKTIRAIMDRFKFRETNLDKYFNGVTEPNKVIKDITQLGIRNTKQRSDIFDSFMNSAYDDFGKFWFIVVKNECRDILREFRLQKNKLITDAIRLSPEGFDETRHLEVAVDERPKVEARILVEQFKHTLKRMNPDYLVMIELMQERNLDPTSPGHSTKFQEALSLSREQYARFLRNFLADLRQVFHRLDMSYEDAEVVLKAAKVLPVRARATVLAWIVRLAHTTDPGLLQIR